MNNEGIEKREAQKRLSWIENVKRIEGFTQEQAEKKWTEIFNEGDFKPVYMDQGTVPTEPLPGIVTVKEDTVLDGIPVKAGEGVLFLSSEGLDPDEISKEGVEIMEKIHAQAEGGDLLNVVYDEVKKLKAENERYIAALKEQMELVEYAFVAGRSKGYSWVQFQEDHKSAIEHAKRLTDGK